LYIDRTIEKVVQQVSETFPVLLVSGPRQIGKTTLLKRMAGKDRKIVSLDNMNIRNLAKTDPELFLQRYEPPILIDEVQYAPELFPYIKAKVDAGGEYGDYWLTGSQMFAMMQHVTESLAGRVGILPMLGLANSEINGQQYGEFNCDIQELIKRLSTAQSVTVKDVFDRIFRGSLPRMYDGSKLNREIYFASYIETYITRDIQNLQQVADSLSFMKFLTLVASRTATNVNYEALARGAEISASTAKRWLSLLVTSGLVILVEPYTHNVTKRIVKSPRMYFADTGLAAYLMGWSSSQVLENSNMSGAFLETWVVTEIYKSYLNAGKRPKFYFYRDSNQEEIDLIIVQNGKIYPIEIKKSANPAHPSRHFATLGDEVETGIVLCLASDVIPLDKKNWLVPVWLI